MIQNVYNLRAPDGYIRGTYEECQVAIVRRLLALGDPPPVSQDDTLNFVLNLAGESGDRGAAAYRWHDAAHALNKLLLKLDRQAKHKPTEAEMAAVMEKAKAPPPRI